MNLLESIVLGIVQGLTEFLPISSSGHLVLVQNVFGIREPQLFFNVMLHFGTLAAVALALWKDVAEIFKNILGKKTWLLVVATIPAVLAALFFKDALESTFGGKFLGFEFVVTGLLLTISESVYVSVSVRKYNDVNFIDAVVMGVLQAFAIFPAISRSGAVIAGGLMRGMERKTAAKFAFLMSIPGILGAFVLEGAGAVKAGLGGVNWLATAVGTLFAFAAGYAAVRFMIAFVSKKRLYGFAIYTLLIGLLIVLDQFVFHLVFKTRPF